MADHVLSNSIVVVLLLSSVALVWRKRRDPLWCDLARELWHRRPVALLTISCFVALALIDSVQWKDAPPPANVEVTSAGDEAVGRDMVGQREAKSLIDRLFADRHEKSYSAPFAQTELYDHSPLRHPGGHPLGTDILGRDVLYLTLKGARVALLIGGLTSLLAIPLALLFGISAGYWGGKIDDLVVFFMSTLASMPSLLLLIALVMAMGRSTLAVCIALAVTSWVGFCRVVRAETLKLRELEYVQAARALDVAPLRIMTRHILPNVTHLIVITFVLMFSGLVLSEAILSWLGLGIAGSWGQMIDQARDELSRDPPIWWNVTAAGSALFTLLLAVNMAGDAVRDILDPRTRQERR